MPKFIEIRDKATFIPALAIEISGADGYLARRAGFGSQVCIILIHLEGMRCAYDPYDWGDRTMHAAHIYLEQHWTLLKSGDVVDVEYILGESKTPKRSEQESYA